MGKEAKSNENKTADSTETEPKSLRFSEEYGLKRSAFYNAIHTLISERAKYPAGSLMNLLYKFMANAGIGAMGRGLNLKMVYDPTTTSYVPVPAGPLTNPLYAG